MTWVDGAVLIAVVVALSQTPAYTGRPRMRASGSRGSNSNTRVCMISFRYHIAGRWRGTVVERRSLAGELSLSCARPAADG